MMRDSLSKSNNLQNKSYSNINLYYFCGFILVLVSLIIDKSFSPDYYAYVAYLQNDIIAIEPTFIIIRYIINKIGTTQDLLFGVYAILGVGIKIISFPRITKILYVTLVLYVCSYWIYHELIQIRAGVASAIFLFSIPFLVDHNVKKYYCCVIIAILFHYSSLILIPLWFLNNSLKNKIWYILLIPISMILYILHFDLLSLISLIPIDFIQNKIQGYTIIANDLSSRGVLDASEYNPFVTWYLLKALYVIILWLNIKNISKYNKYAIVLLKIFTIGITTLWLLSGAPVIATRISELLTIVQILIIPMLLYSRLPRFISYFLITAYSGSWIIWNYSSFIK